MGNSAAATTTLSEVEHQQQRVFYGTQFIVCEVSNMLAERTGIDRPDPLRGRLHWLVGDGDLWVEARFECRA